MTKTHHRLFPRAAQSGDRSASPADGDETGRRAAAANPATDASPSAAAGALNANGH